MVLSDFSTTLAEQASLFTTSSHSSGTSVSASGNLRDKKKRLLLQDEKKKWFYTHSGLYKNYEGWAEGQAVVILLLSKKGSLSVLHTFIQLFTFLRFYVCNIRFGG